MEEIIPKNKKSSGCFNPLPLFLWFAFTLLLVYPKSKIILLEGSISDKVIFISFPILSIIFVGFLLSAPKNNRFLFWLSSSGTVRDRGCLYQIGLLIWSLYCLVAGLEFIVSNNLITFIFVPLWAIFTWYAPLDVIIRN